MCQNLVSIKHYNIYYTICIDEIDQRSNGTGYFIKTVKTKLNSFTSICKQNIEYSKYVEGVDIVMT